MKCVFGVHPVLNAPEYASTTDSGELEELPESDFSWISSLQYLQSNDDDAGLASVHGFLGGGSVASCES